MTARTRGPYHRCRPVIAPLGPSRHPRLVTPPKWPTPASGVRAKTERTQRAEIEAAAARRDQDWDVDALTPVGSSDFEAMSYRAQRASENSKTAVLEIAKVRAENNQGMSEIHGRVDALAANLGDMHVSFARMSGAVEALVPLVHASVGNAMHAGTVTMTAQVKVGEAQQLDVIAEKQWRRDVVIKVLAAIGSGGALTLLIAAALGKC